MENIKQRRRLRKFPVRYAKTLMPIMLSISMSAIISCAVTALNAGITSAFMTKWASAWATAWIVAYPSLLILLPVVRQLVLVIVESPQQPPPT